MEHIPDYTIDEVSKAVGSCTSTMDPALTGMQLSDCQLCLLSQLCDPRSPVPHPPTPSPPSFGGCLGVPDPRRLGEGPGDRVASTGTTVPDLKGMGGRAHTASGWGGRGSTAFSLGTTCNSKEGR